MAAATAVNTELQGLKFAFTTPVALSGAFWFQYVLSLAYLTADFTLRFMWVSLVFITIHLLYKQVSLHPRDTVTDRDSDTGEGDLWW